MNIFQRFVKSFAWIILRFLYRINVNGVEHIPSGGAILAPNHVTFIDTLLIASHINRPVHYAMYWKIYRRMAWIVKPLGAFPIAPKEENAAVYDQAFRYIAAYLQQGDLVCIFPEGQLTRTGLMNPFRSGILKILRQNPVPVIPVGLRNLWGSYFSRKRPGLVKLPDHFQAKIEMKIGCAMVPTTPLDEMQERVALLLA